MLQQLYNIYNEHPVITTDSRICPEGSIFFALKGERFDGNRFATDTLTKGCAYAVIDDATILQSAGHDVIGYGLYDQYFLVPDVLTALQNLAAFHRKHLQIPVIGITGTNGKTTTKELLNAVLSQRYRVLATEGNLNNQIGVPLTLLKIRPEHEMAIVEMGANHPMDIAELCDIARPDYGLITNVGKAHLLGFGSFEGVIAAKTKLYDSLRADGGKVFVDAGNPNLLPHTEGLDAIAYSDASVTADTAVNGAMTSCSPYLELDITVAATVIHVATNLIGNYNLINVVAAAAVGNEFGVAPMQIKDAIEGYQPQNMRSQLIDLGMGRQIILDAYNANPTSMMAALTSFNLNEAPHKSLVLGDMRELGDDSQREHLAVLRYLMQPEVTFGDVLLVGNEFVSAFNSLSDDEVSQLSRGRSVRCYADVESLIADEYVLGALPGTILIKGSRGIRLEQAAKALQSK